MSPSDRRALLFAFAAVLLLRAVAFPFAENVYGDAAVRSEIALRWADEPKLYTSFQDGVFQFGPLHFYWMGAFLKLWRDRELAPRLASLVAGVLTVFPLFRLTQRLFGAGAALAASLGLAAYGLHVQASTTAGSESLFLLLLVAAFDLLLEGLEQGRLARLVAAGALFGLCAATRYDAWLLLPVCGLACLVWHKKLRPGLAHAAAFALPASLFPLFWMWGNHRASGDALYPLHYIEVFHARWVQEEAAWIGQPLYLFHNLFYWPWMLAVSLSPLVFVCMAAGVVESFRRRKGFQLAAMALVPAAIYTLRGVLMKFAPAARFTMPQALLLLPYLGPGFELLVGRVGGLQRRVAVAAVAASALALPVYLMAEAAQGRPLPVYDQLNPVTRVRRELMAAARYVKEHPRQGGVVVDTADGYEDLTLAFYSGVEETRIARKRWEDFEERVERSGVGTVVTFAEGELARTPGFRLECQRVWWRDRRYERVARFGRIAVFQPGDERGP